LVIAHVTLTDVEGRGTVTGVLYDALCSEAFGAALLRTMLHGHGGVGQYGTLSGSGSHALREIGDEAALTPRLLSVEQTNSSIVYGDKLMLKIFRSIEE